jgi:hypothetical protein
MYGVKPNACRVGGQYIMAEVAKFSAKGWETPHLGTSGAKDGIPSSGVIWFPAPFPLDVERMRCHLLHGQHMQLPSRLRKKGDAWQWLNCFMPSF